MIMSFRSLLQHLAKTGARNLKSKNPFSSRGRGFSRGFESSKLPIDTFPERKRRWDDNWSGKGKEKAKWRCACKEIIGAPGRRFPTNQKTAARAEKNESKTVAQSERQASRSKMGGRGVALEAATAGRNKAIASKYQGRCG